MHICKGELTMPSSLWLKNKKLMISLSLVFVILLIITIYIIYIMNIDCFYKGVHIDNINLSGLNIEKAKNLIEETSRRELENWAVVLWYNNNAWSINSKDIILTNDIDNALEKAYHIGRKGNFIYRLKEILKTRSTEINIKTERKFEHAKLKDILVQIKDSIDGEKKDAYVSYENNAILIEDHMVGRNLDIEKNMILIENYILEKFGGEIELLVEEDVPYITSEKIKNIKYIMSSFSTIFNPNDDNRNHNIKTACEKINGTLIAPGEIFSMNKTLGERTAENGYKEAPVIIRNKFVEEIGGGICQVSTTLYVSAVKAGIEIIERRPHSMPLGYVSPGQDATIAGDIIDLKLQNSWNYPICLWSEVKGNTLKIMILGNQNEDDYLIKLKSEIIEEYYPEKDEVIIDDSIEDGVKVILQEARKGLKVAVYKEVYNKEGELLDRIKISVDTYKPVSAQIKVNSRYFLSLEAEKQNVNKHIGEDYENR